MIILRNSYLKSTTLEQREYGIRSIIKKNIDNLRNKAGDKLVKLSKSQWRKNLLNNADYDLSEKAIPSNSKLANKLINVADKRGIKVLDKNKLPLAIGKKNDFTDYIDKPSSKTVERARNYDKMIQSDPNINKDIKEVNSAIASGKSILSLNRSSDKGYNVIAHEIGHNIRRNTKRGKKLAEKVDRLKEQDGLWNSIKRRFALIKHEQDANKEGRKLMKAVGATKIELKEYDKSRKRSIKTYKSAENSKILRNAAKKAYTKNNKLKADFNDL